MNIEELRNLCLRLPHVTEDIKWVNHLCFCVGEKMFFIAGLNESPVTASFKADETTFEKLCRLEGFKPAPYLARYNWVWVSDIGKLNKKEWTGILDAAHRITFEKLPKKIKASLT